jgi:hypothetical protein
VYKTHDDTSDHEIIRKLAIHSPSSKKLLAFTIGELNGAVKQLHPRKAPGPDHIATLMIRELLHEDLKAILHLLNAITRLGHWPRPLKRAKIIMILKPGKDPTDVTSYRPISLLTVISKILEKLILSRLTKELLPPPRHGYHRTNLDSGKGTLQFINATDSPISFSKPSKNGNIAQQSV